MRKKSKAKKRQVEEHSHLTISVEKYEASVSLRINHYAYEPQYAWQSTDEEPVYELSNDLIVSGSILEPADRAGDRCVITLYGADTSVRDLDAKLEDIAEVDENRVPRFRTYRGREVPIYRPPRGLGLIDKARGEPEWRTSLFVKPCLVDRWQTLLGSSRKLFISLHECKAGRKRWVRGIELMTQNPDEQ